MLGNPKISELGLLLLAVNQDIPWLNISMNDTVVVCIEESARNGNSDCESVA